MKHFEKMSSEILKRDNKKNNQKRSFAKSQNRKKNPSLLSLVFPQSENGGFQQSYNVTKVSELAGEKVAEGVWRTNSGPMESAAAVFLLTF